MPAAGSGAPCTCWPACRIISEHWFQASAPRWSPAPKHQQPQKPPAAQTATCPTQMQSRWGTRGWSPCPVPQAHTPPQCSCRAAARLRAHSAYAASNWLLSLLALTQRSADVASGRLISLLAVTRHSADPARRQLASLLAVTRHTCQQTPAAAGPPEAVQQPAGASLHLQCWCCCSGPPVRDPQRSQPAHSAGLSSSGALAHCSGAHGGL